MRHKIRHFLIISFCFFTLDFLFAISVSGTSISISPTYSVISVGQHTNVNINGYSGKSVKWSSSNKKIATVKNGTILGVKAGNAIISAKIKGKKYSCNITVKKEIVTAARERANKITARKYLDIKRRTGYTQIFTGFEEMDYLAEVMLHEMGVKGTMSDEQIIKKIYNYMSMYFVYRKDLNDLDNRLPAYYNLDQLQTQIKNYTSRVQKGKKEGWIKFKPKYGIATGKTSDGSTFTVDYTSSSMVFHQGVCDNHAAIFAILCNHMGIKAGITTGWIHGAGHTWSWAKIDGKKYYFDIGTAIHYYYQYGKQVDYRCYKMKKSDMKSSSVYIFDQEY